MKNRKEAKEYWKGLAEIKKESTHTPTPWSLEGVYFSHYNDKDERVSIWSSVHTDDAAFIVRAVNSHEALVEAIKYAVQFSEPDINYVIRKRLNAALGNAEKKP